MITEGYLDERPHSALYSRTRHPRDSAGGQGGASAEMGIPARSGQPAVLGVVIVCGGAVGDIDIVRAVLFLLGGGSVEFLG